MPPKKPVAKRKNNVQILCAFWKKVVSLYPVNHKDFSTMNKTIQSFFLLRRAALTLKKNHTKEK